MFCYEHVANRQVWVVIAFFRTMGIQMWERAGPRKRWVSQNMCR